MNALRDDDPKFREQTSNLVGLSRASLHKPLANSVQREDCLLLNILDRNKSHVGSRNCFADGLGIGCIVLVGLDLGQ